MSNKTAFATYMGRLHKNLTSYIRDVLQERFDFEDLSAVTEACFAGPKLRSITFSGIEMRVRGVEGATWSLLTAGRIPPTDTPHWRSGEAGFYPAVYAVDAPHQLLEVDVEPGNVNLADYSLVGCSRDGNIVIESTSQSGTTYTCRITQRVTTSGAGLFDIDWGLRSGSTCIVLETTCVGLFFVWSAPKIPWTGTRVWYEALVFALADLDAENKADAEQSLASMVAELATRPQLKYNTTDGAAYCGWIPHYSASQPFDLGKFLRVAHGLITGGWVDHPTDGYKVLIPPPTVACYDMAAALTSLAAALGIPAQPRFFGSSYDESYTSTLGPIRANVKVVGHPTRTVREEFNTHVCVDLHDRCYDPCVTNQGTASFTDMSIDGYLDALLDKPSERKAKLLNETHCVVLDADV